LKGVFKQFNALNILILLINKLRKSNNSIIQYIDVKIQLLFTKKATFAIRVAKRGRG